MPEVLEKLRAVGHDISGLYSKSWELFTGPEAPKLDFVIGFATRSTARPVPISATGGDGIVVVTRPGKIHRPRRRARDNAHEPLRQPVSPDHHFRQFALRQTRSHGRCKRLDEIGAGPVGALVRAGEV